MKKNSKSAASRPQPKSKNRKSIGPSLKASSGTRKTDAGSKKGLSKKMAGKSIKPAAAGAKKGTVRRSSLESRGVRKNNTTGKKVAANMPGKSKILSFKKPVSKSHGKNSSVSSSRPFGQR
jgi:hypothetical protein